jgi:serine/threonine protein kinase
MSAETDTLVGATLEGRFQIERLLGEGGMGRVYIADETRLRRRCAVKVLLPELTQDKDQVERFLREAQSIAQIHHENVVDIHHLGEDTGFGVVFFAMELLSGEDLEMRLADRKKRPIAWLDVCRWMAQVAGAMAAVHAAGLIHRDLKPSNVYLNRRRDGREQVKLLDFGIAKGINRSALTGTGAALGTPYYMSPEQILAEPLDARSDIYSLGVLFFEALAGRMPFVGEPIQVAMQHCNVLPPRPTDIVPGLDIPDELEDLVMAMLEKGRDARVQTMEEVEQHLLMFLPPGGSSVLTSSHARPITVPPLTSSAVMQADASDARAAMSTAPTGQLPVNRSDARSLEIHFENMGDPEAKTNTSPTPLIVPQGQRRVIIAAIATSVLLLLIVIVVVLSTGEQTPPPDPTPVAAPPTKETVVTPPVTPPVVKTDPQPDDPVIEPDPPVGDTGKSNPDPTPPTKKPEAGKTPPRDKDPIKQIHKGAAACRKKLGAVKGPKIVVTYGIGSDGVVKKPTTDASDALSKCLAESVGKVKFPPPSDGIKLGQKISL